MALRKGALGVLADDSTPFPPSFNHPSLGRVRYSVQETSDDPDQQVADTIGLMRRYAMEDASHPVLLADAAQSWASGDPIGDTWAYIKGRLQFVRDESTAAPMQSSFQLPIIETLVRPKDMAVASSQIGDCDDFAMYGAAHLIARGVPVSFVTVAADGGDPASYSHVYLAAYPKIGPYAGRRVPMDLSHGQYPGWETPNRFGKRKEWPCDSRGEMILLAAVIGGGYLLYKTLGGRN